MSKFSDLAAGARAAHASFFAGSVVLYEPTKAAQTVPAVVYRAQTESRTDAQGREHRVSVRRLRFTSLDEVRHDATVQVDGELWSIAAVVERSASGLSVSLERATTHEVARPNYRGKP